MSKFFASFIVMSMLASAAQASQKVDPKYFQLTKVKMVDVSSQYDSQSDLLTQPGLGEDCNPTQGTLVGKTSDQTNSNVDPLGIIEVIVDRIINIGKKIWGVLESGRPVVKVNTYTANALPQGLSCWSDLTGWNVPRSKVYKVSYENAFGSEVVTFAYRVTFTAGGSLDGQGKYITNATIAPADIYVAWGFDLSAQAEVPSVFNTGTKKSPVAGMQMLMKWQVNSVMAEAQQAEAFYVGGDNTMRHLK